MRGVPTLSDAEYDRMIRRLNELEDQYPTLRTPEPDPAGRRGDVLDRVPGGRPPRADAQQLPEELAAWAARAARDANTSTYHYLCELKIDGLAVNLLYENGRLTRP